MLQDAVAFQDALWLLLFEPPPPHYRVQTLLQDKKRRGQPKIWLYKDKATGELNGDATVTYEDAYAATSAPSWFNETEFKGKSNKS